MYSIYARQGGAAEGDFDMATIKKFVSYCRQRCAPRLSAEAGQTLASEVRGLWGRLWGLLPIAC